MEEFRDRGNQGGEQGLVAEEFEQVAEEGNKGHGADSGFASSRVGALLSELGIANPYAAPTLPCSLDFYER